MASDNCNVSPFDMPDGGHCPIATRTASAKTHMPIEKYASRKRNSNGATRNAKSPQSTALKATRANGEAPVQLTARKEAVRTEPHEDILSKRQQAGVPAKQIERESNCERDEDLDGEAEGPDIGEERRDRQKDRRQCDDGVSRPREDLPLDQRECPHVAPRESNDLTNKIEKNAM